MSIRVKKGKVPYFESRSFKEPVGRAPFETQKKEVRV